MRRSFVQVGALFGLLGVGAGALGAHALKDTLDPSSMHTFEVAVRYQMVHAITLMALGLGYSKNPGRMWSWAGRLMTVGTIGFSGSLYGLAFDGPSILGPITPLGGALQILGWGAIFVGACTAKPKE